MSDKTINIDSIRTGQLYEFTCDHGHTFISTVSNIFQSATFGCPVCSGHRVLRGFNDLWTTHPNHARALKDPEDGYRYSYGSNIPLLWVCPDCQREITTTPNKMTRNHRICAMCSPSSSYAEKYVMSLLMQFSIYFQKECTFSWSNGKRYDFYIPSIHCIIETHGRQHYMDSDFSYLQNGRTYEDEQENDTYKQMLAQNVGRILHYVVIDCRKSEPEWLSKRIKESGVLELLQILPSTVDWKECHRFALDDYTKQICEAFYTTPDIKQLAKDFHVSINTVRTKLQHGAKLGWCDYNAETSKKNNATRAGERIVKTMSKPVIQMDLSGNDLKEFPSIQEAIRQTKVSKIWECVSGRRMTAGGYKWRYK